MGSPDHAQAGARRRHSTAGRGNTQFIDVCLRRLPVGRIINLGAGTASVKADGRFVVNVDHVAPPGLDNGIFIVADAAALPFRSNSFNGVLAKDILEHVQNPMSVLVEIHRAVDDKGVLLIIVPRAIPRAVWDDPTHVRGFTRHALRTALKGSGWESDGPIRKVGGVPGAGRLGLTAYLDILLRAPGVGHWFGTNWMVMTRPATRVRS